MLDDWIEAYEYYMHDSECPRSYLKWVAIGTVAAALQRKVYLEWGGALTFYPNFYTVLVGPPGETRKGTAMAPARKILNEVGISLSPDSVTREQLIRVLKEANETDVNLDSGVSTTHSSLTVFSPEFTVFLGHNNPQLLTDLTDWYDCTDLWSYETKGQGKDHIHGVWLNIIGATTPASMQASLASEAVGTGLASRIIFVCELEPFQRNPTPFFAVTDEGKELKDKLVHDLQLLYNRRGRFTMSSPFLAKYVNWYNNLSPKCPFDEQRFSGYWSRRQMHLLKLAMILSASKGHLSKKGNLELREEDFDNALALLEKTEQKMPIAFSGVGRSNLSEIMAPIMAKVSQVKKISYGELLQCFMRDVTTWELDKIIQTFEKVGFADIVHTGSEIWIVKKDRRDEDQRSF